MKKRPDWKERRVYFFSCEKCGKKRRQSYKRSKARRKLCRRCQPRVEKINPNQGILFPSIGLINGYDPARITPDGYIEPLKYATQNEAPKN